MTTLTRYTAADISKFTEACTIVFAFGPQDGYIYYAVEADIELPSGQVQKHAAVAHFHTKQYSQDEVGQVIVQLWTELVQAGFIGNTKLPERPLEGAVSVLDNPINHVLQVADALVKHEHARQVEHKTLH